MYFPCYCKAFLKVDGILLDAMVQLKIQYVIYCCICKVMVFILLQKTFVLLSFLKNSMQFVIWWNGTRKSKYPIKFEEKNFSLQSMFSCLFEMTKTRVIIKILKKMIPHMKPKVVFIGKKNQNGQVKKAHFPAPPILNIFSQKFHGLVLG